jgi:hypothetical protein
MKVGHDKVGVMKAGCLPAVRKGDLESQIEGAPHRVAIQLLSFRPVGTAMIIVPAVK